MSEELQREKRDRVIVPAVKPEDLEKDPETKREVLGTKNFHFYLANYGKKAQNESIGGNAGAIKLQDGLDLSCLAVNSYFKTQTAELRFIGNIQNIRGNSEFDAAPQSFSEVAFVHAYWYSFNQKLPNFARNPIVKTAVYNQSTPESVRTQVEEIKNRFNFESAMDYESFCYALQFMGDIEWQGRKYTVAKMKKLAGDFISGIVKIDVLPDVYSLRKKAQLLFDQEVNKKVKVVLDSID